MHLFDLGDRIARNAHRIPVVGRILQDNYRRSFFQGRGRYHGIYKTFAEAQNSIPTDRRVGFDHPELASMYRNRFKANPSDYPVLYWLRRILAPNSVIYDFGGHVGLSYHGWREYLDYPADLRWRVYDLPAITRIGEEMARARTSPGLSFTNRIEDANDCTIFLAAGSLQFSDRSLASLLDQAGCRPLHVIMNKMPLQDGEPYATVQSAGDSFHPYQILNRAQFVEGIEKLGYRIVDTWENAEQFCHIPFHRDRDIDAYSGYYFTRDSQ